MSLKALKVYCMGAAIRLPRIIDIMLKITFSKVCGLEMQVKAERKCEVDLNFFYSLYVP